VPGATWTSMLGKRRGTDIELWYFGLGWFLYVFGLIRFKEKNPQQIFKIFLCIYSR
jgi:hypothetical protein